MSRVGKAQAFPNDVRFRYLARARLGFNLSRERLGQSYRKRLHAEVVLQIWQDRKTAILEAQPASIIAPPTLWSRRRVGRELQRDAVDAVAQAGRRRPVLEDMAEMAAAAPAMHLGARHQQGVVGLGADGFRQRAIEARPAGPAVVFRLRCEQRQIAGCTGECALAFLVIERARARDLGAVQAQHLVLRLAEDRAPLAVALLNFEPAGRLDVAALQPAPSREQGDGARTRQQQTTVDHGYNPSCPTAPRAAHRARN